MTHIPSQEDQQRLSRLNQINDQMAAIIAMLPQLDRSDAHALRPKPGQFGPQHTIGISSRDGDIARNNLRNLRLEQVRHCRYLGISVPPPPAEIGSESND